MVVQGVNPTARRWELAARLRQLRLDAGRSVDDAARELMCSPAKISRMETAGRGVQPRDVRDLCRLYGTSDAVRDDLMQAVADARKPGWWQDFRTLDDQVQTFLGLEAAAAEVRFLDPQRLPGMLQNADYTAALLPQLRPPGELTDEWMADTVASRGKRYDRVSSGELTLKVILDEAALRRPIGGVTVMLKQIDRLIRDSTLPNVTLQVVPFEVGPYPGLEGSFQHLTFPSGYLEDVAFVEGLLGTFLLDKQAETDRYLAVFDDISRRFALSASRTKTWLRELRAELEATKPRLRNAGGG